MPPISESPPKRLAIVLTHPIQYYSPVFEKLSARPDIKVKVFYGSRGATQPSIDRGFGVVFAWDIPLLDGYEYEFCENISKEPGTHHFGGMDLPELNRAIEAWNADAVLIYGWSLKAHLNAMRHFHGRIPVLYRGDSTLLDERGGWRKIARRLYLRWIFRHIDLALYVGTNNRRYFEAMGLKSHQLVFAPHAIDNDRFAKRVPGSTQAGSPGAEIRKMLGISDDQIVILFAGKVERKKSPDLLIAAFKQAEFKNASLVIVGDGELREELERAGGRNIHFVGFKNQTELPEWYRVADLLVLPSRGPGETWGLALNEAMACGLPVIASERVGSAIDLITQDVNGWVFKSDSVEDLASCLKNAVSIGKQGLSKMGEKSLEIIANWSFDRQVDAIATAAISLVKRKK